MAKTMTVQAIGFQIVGMTALALWGGGEGVIPMEPVKLAHESFPTEEQIREAINDNGFGVECMEGAIVRRARGQDLRRRSVHQPGQRLQRQARAPASEHRPS